MVHSTKNRDTYQKKYKQELAESISMAIKDETGDFVNKKEKAIDESIDEDSIDSFDEYLESKFGTSIMRSGVQQSKSNMGFSKSAITEKIGKYFYFWSS